MSAHEIPLATTKRQQLVKVVDAAEAMVTATADWRMPQDCRDAAFHARYVAWGALNDYDVAATSA
jgi:hypothetical protein